MSPTTGRDNRNPYARSHVGSQFSEENVIAGILGVEDYSIAPFCIMDA